MKVDLESLLPHVRRPVTYVGNEFNSVHKDHSSVKVKVALAYPDRYEIGMSNLGMRIVYHLLNKFPQIVCERVFAPWTDMEDLLREKNVPLFALESGTPVNEFDVVAFTVGYELTYTNILNMLDLSGLPLLSCERKEGDPLVIAGGSCMMNPEPLAQFFDCIFVGDGEDSVRELGDVLLKTKDEKAGRRETMVALSEIPGTYVPSLGTPTHLMRRVSDELRFDDFPCEPIVPYSEITHDRLAVEIMRGCPRACKFCQSSVMYGPVRRRSPEDIVELANRSLQSSGWEEMSLVSLSPTDYPRLGDLVGRLSGTLNRTKTSLTLSSLRADSLTSELGSALKMVKKASVTLAPEAGTERLRDKIAKPMSEGAILESAKTAYDSGFGRLKLYFVIGLPSETDEDVEAIVGLCKDISDTGRGKQLRVSISGFVPKAHTPFERERQEDAEELTRKARHIKSELKRRRIDVKWHNPRVSLLETVMSRGDRKMSDAILTAFKKGCRFDGWSEKFDHEKWMASFEESSIDPLAYTGKIAEGEKLPWSFIELNALRSERGSVQGIKQEERSSERAFGRRSRTVTKTVPQRVGRYRVKYMKHAEIRFMSHLDMMRAIVRTLRRANLPLTYSHGFSPRPKVSFGPPLSVGMTSACEYFDFMIDRPFTGDLPSAISSAAPMGLEVISITPVFVRSKSLSEILDVAEYKIKNVRLPDTLLEEFMSREECIIEQTRGEKRREIDVMPLLFDLKSEDGGLSVRIRMSKKGWVGPIEILSAIKGEPKEEFLDLDIERTGLYTYKEGALLSPITD